MTLNQLLDGFVSEKLQRNPIISGLAVDSRHVKTGDVFFAYRGNREDGVKFIHDAVRAGAVAVVIDGGEGLSEDVEQISVPVCRVANLYQNLGFIASRFFHNPTASMSVVGITGTNGKTSCSHILAQVMTTLGVKCGVIGTLGVGVWPNLESVINTTPGALTLQECFASLRDEQVQTVFMEVSSHGLQQFRVNGCQFDVAMFTNLSRDHLDYHGDMASYGAAKLKLFTDYSVTKVVVNADDGFAEKIVNAVDENVELIATTLKENCTIKRKDLIVGEIVKTDRTGTQVRVTSQWGAGEFHSALLGEFNMSNLLNVLAVLLLLDVPFDQALLVLESAQAPNGRLETYFNSRSPLVVVDYAHTPDALEKTLATLKHHTQGKLFLLFGCGGDRDRGKRPEMGCVAEKYADVIWLTNDNPRTENPQQIIHDIMANMVNQKNVVVELDREKAIRGIIALAAMNDVVLIAGKGHEDYQIIGEQSLPFSDGDVVAQIIGEAA